MTISDRKKSLIILGKFLSQYKTNGFYQYNEIPHNKPFFEIMSQLIDKASETNPWFTRENVVYALETWSNMLTSEKIDKWLNKYSFSKSPKDKNIGIIMAGNIPLVGFHDSISVLISGHRALIKLSSNDKYFLPLLAKYLISIEPRYKNKIEFVDGNLKNFDAVIATGSNNTSRYFEYYFGKYPHIIRKNKNSVAVLTGNETEEHLEGLADDMMLYFGLGCRNVSKIFVPENYNFNPLFKALLKYKHLIGYQKYINNYNYNKAVYLMSTDMETKNSLIDNGLILFKKDYHYASPIGTVFYEYYHSLDDVKKIIERDQEQIQTVVSQSNQFPQAICFGSTQQPQLWDYADNIDTINFLMNL